MAADAFSLRCSPKAQVNLAFELRSLCAEPWVSNPSYQTNEKYPRQAQVFFIGWGGRIRTFDLLLQRQAPYRLATPHCPICLFYQPSLYLCQTSGTFP